MAKDAQEKTPEQKSTASQIQARERSSTERDPGHGSHVVNGTICQGSVGQARNTGHHEDRGLDGMTIHAFRATQVDGNSNMLNGSVTNGHGPPTRSIHLMDGGSVTNSRIANGNLAEEEFLQFFCNRR